MCKRVTIESCTSGFLVWNHSEGLKTKERYAVSQEKMIQKVKELLGITHKSKVVDSTFPLVNLAMTGDVKPESPVTSVTETEPKSQSKIETALSPSSPFSFKELTAFDVSVQPITKGKTIYWLHPGGTKIKISRNNYQTFIHMNLSDLVYLYEHPAEVSSIIMKYGKATYANKAVILRGFLKDVPLSALVGGTYNDEVIKATEDEPLGQEDGSCDDVAFESCANNTPEQCKYCIDQSRYQNKRKLAAKKPAPPLMKASVSP